jgi:branched-chain amino acid transport system ATP-binding protein
MMIARLHRERLSILMEQNMMQSLDIAGRAYVIETGRVALSGPAATLASDQRLRAAYPGI